MQIGHVALKDTDFDLIVQKMCHCAPKINEMTAIIIHHVKNMLAMDCVLKTINSQLYL